MMRQSSSRNQRYKGWFRFRHFLQVCLLIAICIWLVYQVKHSHGKKRAFVEKKEDEEQAFSFRFGRKDLPTVSENELRRETRDMDEDEVQEQEMRKEDAWDEEGRGDVDDWIDEQDQDQRGVENEQEVETKSEIPVREANSVDRLEHEDGVLDARENSNKSNNVSRSVTHETHMTEAEAGHADARGLDEKKPNDINANVRESSSNVADDVSNKIYNSANNGDLNSFISNLSSIGWGENNTLPETTNHSMNGTVFGVLEHENGSNSSLISAEENIPTELQTNSTTAALPVFSTISTANVSESLKEAASHSTGADSPSYKAILGNETASLMPVNQNLIFQNETSGENHSKLEDLVVEFEHNPKPNTSEEQESEDQFATVSFSKNEVHTAITEEEREARTDLSTLPEIHNDRRHDYDEIEE